ncbi:MAG: hypothetical protein ACE5NN_02100 [Candidatus Bathyarchaeia archaeon]
MIEKKEIDLKTIVKLCERAITKDIWYDDSECTKRFKLEFSQFAEELGYRVQPNQQNQTEFLTIDMVWWSNGRMVAAIEHENVPRTDPIADEWKKLAYVDADYRMLISYCSRGDLRKDWLRRASEIISKNPRGKEAHFYLLLGDETLWGFRGYEFDNSGKLMARYR